MFDSPPDFNGIAAGVSKSMGINGPIEKVIEVFIKGVLKVLENSSGVEHKASSAAFHDNAIQAPALWFYSKADPVSRWQDCEIVMDKWKAKGTIVESCFWLDTPHIQHGRKDPDRYFGTLDTFLKKHRVI